MDNRWFIRVAAGQGHYRSGNIDIVIFFLGPYSKKDAYSECGFAWVDIQNRCYRQGLKRQYRKERWSGNFYARLDVVPADQANGTIIDPDLLDDIMPWLPGTISGFLQERNKQKSPPSYTLPN